MAVNPLGGVSVSEDRNTGKDSPHLSKTTDLTSSNMARHDRIVNRDSPTGTLDGDEDGPKEFKKPKANEKDDIFDDGQADNDDVEKVDCTDGIPFKRLNSNDKVPFRLEFCQKLLRWSLFCLH